MAYEFKLPDLGEGLTEGEIVEWLVKEGDPIEEDQVFVKVETDKAVLEIPSPRKGMVLRMGPEPRSAHRWVWWENLRRLRKKRKREFPQKRCPRAQGKGLRSLRCQQ